MFDNFEKFFKDAEIPEPPQGLGQKIVREIAVREMRRLRIKIAAAAGIFAASIYFVVVGFLSLWAQLVQSGFFAFAALAFSDFSSTLANFPDFASSLAESFPIFSAAIILAGLAAVIWSAAMLVDGTTVWRRHIFSSFR